MPAHEIVHAVAGLRLIDCALRRRRSIQIDVSHGVPNQSVVPLIRSLRSGTADKEVRDLCVMSLLYPGEGSEMLSQFWRHALRPNRDHDPVPACRNMFCPRGGVWRYRMAEPVSLASSHEPLSALGEREGG